MTCKHDDVYNSGLTHTLLFALVPTAVHGRLQASGLLKLLVTLAREIIDLSKMQSSGDKDAAYKSCVQYSTSWHEGTYSITDLQGPSN
jgi:hypothetical protein